MKTTENNASSNSRNDKRYFFYSCPGLDLWSVGASRQEAERQLRQEMFLLLLRCSKYDQLDYFLLDSCFKTVEVRAS